MLINDLFTFYYDFLSQLWLIILFWLEHLLKEFKKTFFLFLCWRNIYIIDLKYLIQFLLLNIWKIPFLKDDVIALFVSLHYIQFDCLHCQLAFILVCFSQFFFFFYQSSLFVVVWLLSHVWLFATPWTVAPPGFSVHGISQARILESVAISFSRGPSQPRDRTRIGRWILYHWATWEAWRSSYTIRKKHQSLC